MKKILSLFSLLALSAMWQFGMAEDPHFNLIGSFNKDNWSPTSTDNPVNKSYNNETSKYYIDVDVVNGTTYYFAFNNGTDRYAPFADGENKTLDLTDLQSYKVVKAADGKHACGTGASYKTDNCSQDVSNKSWKITANYTGKLRICLDESGEDQHYYPYVWLERPAYYLIGDVISGENYWSTDNKTAPITTKLADNKYYRDFYISKDNYFAFNYREMRYAPSTSPVEISTLPAICAGARKDDYKDNSWKFTGDNRPVRVIVDLTNGDGNPTITLEKLNVYMIGAATSAGWSADNAIQMSRSDADYSWEGYLCIGEMKLLTAKSLTDYYQIGPKPESGSGETYLAELQRNADVDAKHFNDNATHAYNDYKFNVTSAGWYKITYKFKDNKFRISSRQWPEKIYPVGGGCWVGWSTEGKKAMSETATNSGIYKDTLKLNNSGELKFLCKTGEYGAMFGKQASTADISECGTYNTVMTDGKEDNDSKWAVSLTANTYFVLLDATQGQVRIHPYLASVNLNPDKTELTIGDSVVFTPTVPDYSGNLSCTYYVNNEQVALVNNTWKPAKSGSYQVKVQIEAEEQTVISSESTITVSTKDVTVRLHATTEAQAVFNNAYYLYYWGASTAATMATFSAESEGWREVTVNVSEELKFLIKSVNDVNEWNCYRSVDIDNAGKGYLEDVCVELLSRKNESQYYRAYELSGCTYSANQFTINAYVDEALKNDINSYQVGDVWVPSKWDKVSFYTYGDAHMQYNDYWVSDITAGADGWYSYNYQNVDQVNLVIAGSTSWTGNPYRQSQDILNLSASKYYYVTNGSNGQTNRVAIELDQKVTPLTFTFRFSDVAKQTWENKDVYLRYWMNYQEPGEDAARDHVFFKQLTADGNGIYSCTIFPIAPVALTIQSCGTGYHGDDCQDGHWTNDLSDGYTTNKDFIIKDYNAGGHVLEEYTAEQMTIQLTPDGYATACWDKAWTTSEVNVYTGKYIVGKGLELTQVTDGIVPANTGVILYNSTMGSQKIALVATQSESSFDYTENELKGTVSLTNRDQSKTTYVLGYQQGDNAKTMLYTYTAEQIPSYKAYLEISGSSAPQRMSMFIRETSTGMMNVNENLNVNHKVMINGQLIIIRDGKQYNAQGALLQ